MVLRQRRQDTTLALKRRSRQCRCDQDDRTPFCVGGDTGGVVRLVSADLFPNWRPVSRTLCGTAGTTRVTESRGSSQNNLVTRNRSRTTIVSSFTANAGLQGNAASPRCARTAHAQHAIQQPTNIPHPRAHAPTERQPDEREGPPWSRLPRSPSQPNLQQPAARQSAETAHSLAYVKIALG